MNKIRDNDRYSAGLQDPWKASSIVDAAEEPDPEDATGRPMPLPDGLSRVAVSTVPAMTPPVDHDRSSSISSSGKKLAQQLRQQWCHLPFGTTVVINVETEELIWAPSGVEAIRLFEEKFGEGVAGWSFDVGRPITVGGGAGSWRF